MEELSSEEVEREITAAERRFRRIDARAARLDALKTSTDAEKISAFANGEFTRREIVVGDSRYVRGELVMLSANSEVVSALNVGYAPLMGALRKMREMSAGYILIYAPIAQIWTNRAPACADPAASAYLEHFTGFSVCNPAVVGIDQQTAKNRFSRLFSVDPEKTMQSIFIAVQRAQLLCWAHPFLLLREVEFLTSIATEYQSEIQRNDKAMDIVTGWFEKLGLQSPFSASTPATPAPEVDESALGAAAAALAAIEAEEDGGDMYTFTPGM